MFGNKVSPATLCPTSDSSNASGAEDSQLCNSQASLFSSEPSSSLELFPDIHSQPQGQQVDKFMQLSSTQQQRSRQPPARKPDTRFQPEISLSRKFYLKYLKSGCQQDSPRNTSSRYEESQSSTISSQPAAYEAWRTKQADKLESQQFMTEIQKAVKEGMKAVECELRSEIEELRASMIEQKSSITHGQAEISTQILTTLADLKQCIEQQFCQQRECSQSLTAKLEAQSSSVTLKLEQLCKDLRETVQSLETRIESSVSRNLTTALQCNHCQPGQVMQDRGVPVESAASVIAREREVNVAEEDQAVPCQQNGLVSQHDLLQNSLQMHLQNGSSKTLGNVTDCSKSRTLSIGSLDDQICSKSSKGSQVHSSFSTTCDIDLTNQSPSACSQVIANILGQDESNKPTKRVAAESTSAHTEERRGPKRRRVQSKPRPKPTQRTPHKRRSKRLQKTSIPLGYESEESDDQTIALVPRKSSQITSKSSQRLQRPQIVNKPSQIPQRPQSSSISKTPTAAVDMCFFSQTPTCKPSTTDHERSSPGVLVLNTENLQNMATDKTAAMEKFHRSTEAARRRVKVFAGMSNPTSALLELSNSIRNKVTSENYSEESQ